MIGVILLAIGVALVLAGGFGALNSSNIIGNFSQPSTGEYVSNEIILNASSTVIVTSPATDGGMVPAQYINEINSSTVESFVVPYNSTTSGDTVYNSLIGDYYYVVFSSTQPSTQIVVTGGPLSEASVSALAVLSGFGLSIIGIVVAIIGAVQKKRPMEVKA
jgi:hypothetical protein